MKSRKDKTVSVTTSLLLMAAVVLSSISCATNAGELEKNAIRLAGSVAVGAGATTLLKESEHPVLYAAAYAAYADAAAAARASFNEKLILIAQEVVSSF
jgi:hypothetical protein